MPTIRQIAKAAGVSPMTVSFVLNGKFGQVSDDTRERVLRVVREMGYRPRAASEKPSATAVRTIGVASWIASRSYVEPGYFSAILSSILNAADQRAITTSLFHRGVFQTEAHRSIRTYLDGRCDGMLLIAPGVNLGLIPALIERGIPFVVIGDQFNAPGEEGVGFADVDSYGDAMNAVSYLADLGHRRIAYVGGSEGMPSVRLRRDGYRAALERRGLPYDPELESGDLSNYTSVYEWVVAVMRKPIARPTAFFCWNDATALRSLMALQDMNIRVPEEVSLVGFDDDPAASYSHPSLTTLRQPYREIGEQAVEGLLARIDDYNAPPPRIVLPARLIIRDSTAPPPV